MVFEKGGALSIVNAEWTISRAFPAMGTLGCGIIGPNKVYYSDDPAFRVKKLIYRHEGWANVFPYDLGMVKGTHWFYEQEWRFKIAAVSFEAQVPDDDYFNNVTLDLKKYPVLTECLFVPLDPSVFDEMEVTIGPKADDSAVEAVEAILSAFAPRARIVRSKVPIR
jgi:hypothetical protein